MWAKLEAMAEGARIASRALWGNQSSVETALLSRS